METQLFLPADDIASYVLTCWFHLLLIQGGIWREGFLLLRGKWVCLPLWRTEAAFNKTGSVSSFWTLVLK